MEGQQQTNIFGGQDTTPASPTSPINSAGAVPSVPTIPPLDNPNDTGDIIISSAPDKPKVSRPLLLGIIIGVLVLIGGAVATVVLLNQNKSNGTQVATKVDGTTITTADNYKDSFLLYANYILTGVASTDPLPDAYDPDADYPIWDVYTNKNQEYLAIADSYLENFQLQLNDYIAESDEDMTYIDSSVHAYIEQFKYAKEYIDGDITVSTNGEGDTYQAIRGSEIFVVEHIWDIWSAING